VFYLRFKVYPLHCVLATQARVCGPGRAEPTRIRIRIRAIRATSLLIYSHIHIIRIALKLLIVAIIKASWVIVLDSEVICIPPLQDSIVIAGPTLTFAYTPL
jgi:hypothetical protein